MAGTLYGTTPGVTTTSSLTSIRSTEVKEKPCSSCTVWVHQVLEDVVAGKIHSIPRQCFNGYSVAHGSTLLTIVVVHVVRSYSHLPSPYRTQEDHTEIYSVHDSFLRFYPTELRLLQRDKIQHRSPRHPGPFCGISSSTSTHHQ